MKRLHPAYALACLLAGGAPAFAQTAAGVADPQAAVPATTYQPAIRPDAAPAPAPSPDQAWRAANATVGGRNAMSLTMPGMGGKHDMGGHAMHGAAPAAAGHAQHAGAAKDMQCMAGGQGCRGGAHAAGMHAGHAGMPMGAAASGQQCMAGSSDKGCCGEKCCCAGKPAAVDHAGHAGHAGMAMDHGCCDHKEAK